MKVLIVVQAIDYIDSIGRMLISALAKAEGHTTHLGILRRENIINKNNIGKKGLGKLLIFSIILLLFTYYYFNINDYNDNDNYFTKLEINSQNNMKNHSLNESKIIDYNEKNEYSCNILYNVSQWDHQLDEKVPYCF